ncbi:hypothetical protein FRC03_001522 [Tulasnella sp. 419]|nr:hypothetical protein FRC03_001522 [Tulasnella sp. 419]
MKRSSLVILFTILAYAFAAPLSSRSEIKTDNAISISRRNEQDSRPVPFVSRQPNPHLTKRSFIDTLIKCFQRREWFWKRRKEIGGVILRLFKFWEKGPDYTAM